MSSPQEAETGVGFYNAQQLVPLRLAPEDLGHPQGPTPLQFNKKAVTAIRLLPCCGNLILAFLLDITGRILVAIARMYS